MTAYLKPAFARYEIAGNSFDSTTLGRGTLHIAVEPSRHIAITVSRKQTKAVLWQSVP